MKILSIIFVIILHSLTREQLLALGAPYYLWQAVPMFMLLNGFNNALSFKRRQFNTLSELYNFEFIWEKIKKILVPYSIFIVVELVIIYVTNADESAISILLHTFSGGWGPGSYFVAIIIQSILILPILYLVITNFKHSGLIMIFVINIGLEFLTVEIGINEKIYHLLIIRYIFSISLGMWVATNRVKDLHVLFFALVSAIYIFAVNYKNIVIINEFWWGSQHAFAYGWTLLLALMILKLDIEDRKGFTYQLLDNIGSSTFHIFLFQMIYFTWIIKLIPNVNLLISLFICLIGGIAFRKTQEIILN